MESCKVPFKASISYMKYDQIQMDLTETYINSWKSEKAIVIIEKVKKAIAIVLKVKKAIAIVEKVKKALALVEKVKKSYSNNWKSEKKL